MSASSISISRFTNTQKDVVVSNRVRNVIGPPAVYCHSAGMWGGEIVGSSQLTTLRPIINAVVDEIKIFVTAFGAPALGELWGNAFAKTHISDAVAWLRANDYGNDDPVVLMGSSMGVCASLSWAAANPSDVACIIGFIPCIDLQANRVSSPSVLRPSIDAAYGVTYPAAMPGGTDPATMTAQLAGIPMQLWYASDDVVSANIATFAAAGGMDVDLRNVGALGHTSAAVAAADTSDIVDFIKANI